MAPGGPLPVHREQDTSLLGRLLLIPKRWLHWPQELKVLRLLFPPFAPSHQPLALQSPLGLGAWRAGCRRRPAAGPFPNPPQEQMCSVNCRPGPHDPQAAASRLHSGHCPGRWRSRVLSLTPKTPWVCSFLSALSLQPHLVLPGLRRCVYVAGFLGNHPLILQAGKVRR